MSSVPSRRAVLFDLDETLLDRTASLTDFLCWQVRGMLRNSVSSEQEFIDRFLLLDEAGTVWKDKVYSVLVQEFNISDWSVDELLASYELCFCGFCKLKPNAFEALQSLHKSGYKLGLVSNGKYPFQLRNFNALGIEQLFGSVIISEEVGFRKPDPEIFSMCCEALKSNPNECVFVGDNPIADIDGANALGLYSIFIPGASGESCAAADAVCPDFSTLPELVRNAK